MNIGEAREALRGARRVAVLTGAGVSAESGIPTFRDAQTGLWARFRPEDLASPEAYRRDPDFVWAWYAERYRTCLAAEPNEAHRLLARLGDETKLGLVTQNVDGLHARAGSTNIVELHGNLTTARCETCRHVFDLPRNFEPPPLCPLCPRCGSRARPNVVWFGENLPRLALERAHEAFENADVALVIGTSAVVYPAAALPELTRSRHRGVVIEVNPEETPLTSRAHLSLRTSASRGLAELMGEPLTSA